MAADESSRFIFGCIVSRNIIYNLLEIVDFN